MLGSAFFFALLGLLIKILDPSYRLWDIAMYRLGGGTLALWVLFGWKTPLFKPQNPKLMIIRGITGSAAFLSLVIAIQNLPLSTAMVFFYTFPSFAAIFSPLLFGERITYFEIICLLLALMGVSILFDFNFEGSFYGQLMGVTGAMFAGLTVAIIKRLKSNHGSISIYFYFCLVGTLICAGPYLRNPRIPATFTDWNIVLGILVTSIAAQLLMNKGFQYCKSWEGGLWMTSELLFSSLLGIYLLHEPFGWRLLTGSCFIISGGVAYQLWKRPSPDILSQRCNKNISKTL